MKSKGLTIVELLVSIILLSIIMIFVFSLLIDVRQEELRSNFSSKDVINRSIIIRDIQKDFIEKGISNVTLTETSTTQTFEFTFLDSTDKTLIVTADSVKYGNELWKISSAKYDLDKTCYLNESKGDKDITTIQIGPDLTNRSIYDNVLLDIELFHVSSVNLPDTLGSLPKCSIDSVL